MKLTFVFEAFSRGGKERRCLQLIQGLNKRGINDIQVIIINDNIDYPELYNTSAQIVCLLRKQRDLTLFKSLSLLKATIQSFKPDIIVSWGTMSGVMLTFLKPFINAKFISAFVADTIRTKALSKKRLMRRLIIKSNEKVIGNSQAGLDAYLVPKEKGIRIVNGFNYLRLEPKVFNKETLRKDLGVTNKYLVIMLARFNQTHKDYQSFIKVAKEVRKQRTDISFIGIGAGNDERKGLLKTLTEEDKKYIQLLDYRSDIENILRIADISILLSNLQSGEGISNTIMESMAFGVPVIATWGGGTPEIIENGINGFMVKNNDIDSIVKLTNSLLNDQDLYSIIVENGKKTVKSKFSLDAMTDSFLQLFTSIMNL